jgi:hypothetical protein
MTTVRNAVTTGVSRHCGPDPQSPVITKLYRAQYNNMPFGRTVGICNGTRSRGNPNRVGNPVRVFNVNYENSVNFVKKRREFCQKRILSKKGDFRIFFLCSVKSFSRCRMIFLRSNVCLWENKRLYNSIIMRGYGMEKIFQHNFIAG